MARKYAKGSSAPEKAVRSERAEFVGYVNFTLTEEDRSHFESWDDYTAGGVEPLADALSMGYQFTLKFDHENDSYSCSISTWDRDRPDSGVIYTARSDDPDRARLKAVYVWDQKLDRNLNNGVVKGARRDAF